MSKIEYPVSPDHASAPASIKLKSLWLYPQIAVLMLSVGISYIGFGLVVPLRTLYAREEGASGGEVGFMAAAYLFASFIFLLPFGWLSDRVNRMWMIVIGLLVHGVITLAFLVAHDGTVFIALRFVEGITTAAVLPAARAMLADLTPNGRNGESFGLLSAMMSLGIFAGPPAGTFLASGFGYTTAYLVSSVLFLPAAIAVYFALKEYQPVRHPIKTKAEKQQFTPSQKLLTPPILIGCLVRAALALGPGLGMSIWSIYCADLGFDLNLIGWTYTVYAIPIVLVSPYAGRFSDRYGRLGMMFIPALLLGFMWMSYGFITAFIIFMILGVIEGSIDSMARSANEGYLADYSPSDSRGKAQGLFNAVTQFGSLVSAIVAGFLYEIQRSLPFYVMGGLQVALVLLAVGLHFGLARKRLTAELAV